MYQDQHTIESMGTARLIARNAYAYESYLSSVFGREWRFAAPAEIKGPARLKVKFVPEEAASGEASPPCIILWVEYNPAMGLYTVWGEYWTVPGAEGPAYKSSPRTGFDDEMLGDAARLFDWLDVSVTYGEATEAEGLESVAEALSDMVSPAGAFVDADIEMLPGGEAMLVLEPEMRMPKDYFVSGTRFPGMAGPDEQDYGYGSESEWFDSYVSPVQGMVQSTLDNLYGVGSYKAEVDPEGFVLVSGLKPVPPQNFKSGSGGAFSPSDNLPTHDNLALDGGLTGRFEDKDVSHDAMTQLVASFLGGLKTPVAGKLKNVKLASRLNNTLVVMPENAQAYWRKFGMTNEWNGMFVEPAAQEIAQALRARFNAVFVVQGGEDHTELLVRLPSKANVSMESTKQRTAHADAILRMAGVGGHKRFADRSLDEAWYDSGTVIDISDKPKKKQPPPKFGKVKDADNMAAFDALVKKLKDQKKSGAKIRDPEALAAWIGLRKAGKKGAAARGQSAEESVESPSTPVAERMKALLK